MPDSRPLRPAEPDRLGDYQVLGLLGEGGQGTVYLAEAPGGGRVAVKVLHLHRAIDENAHRRFVREVEAARRVAAFTTARVIDVNLAGEQPYIVSEYVEGVSLDVRVRQRGVLGEDELVRLAVGTANALAAIHSAGVVHRDFKPSNVLLGPDGPRVIDFGIARALDSFTVTGSGVVGTPTYMSPEQISDRPIGPPADVFSWASTMVFAATGRPLFEGDGVPAVLYSILTAAPDLSGVPDVLRPLLERCLAKEPEQRPTAADIMLHLVGHTPKASEETTLPLGSRRGRRWIVASAGAAHAAGARVVGADADESQGVDEELRRAFVTSIVKRIDVVVLDYLRSAAEGRAPSGPKEYGVREGVIDYLPTGTGLSVIKPRLDEIKRRMADGALTVS